MLLFIVVVSSMIAAKPTAVVTTPDDVARRKYEGVGIRIAVLGLLTFLTCYVALIFYKEDFADYDNSQFTLFTLRGQNFGMPIWPKMGRFFPFGNEYDILRFFTSSNAGYHVLGIVELLGVLAALFFILKEIPVRARFLVMFIVAITPSILLSFFGLMFPERNVIALLTCLIAFVYGYSRSGFRGFLVGGLVAAQCVLYFKETAFALVLGFAGTRLIFAWFARRQIGGVEKLGRRVRDVISHQAMEVGMLAAVCGFLSIYAIVTLHPNLQYAENMRSSTQGSSVSVALAYAKVDALLLIFVAALTTRLVVLARQRIPIDPFWDALAVGGALYMSAYIVLRIYSPYYMAPADFVAILYLSWLSGKIRNGRLVYVLTSAVVLQSVANSSFILIERKNTIAAKIDLANFVETYVRDHGTQQTVLYFPNADGYKMMELSAFLGYKGIQMSTDEVTGSTEKAGVTFESPRTFPNNLCVDFRPRACFHADAPPSGALTVLLPDDAASQTDVLAGADRRYNELLTRMPFGVSRLTLPILSRLHGSSLFFWDKQLPAHWLELHILQAPNARG